MPCLHRIPFLFRALLTLGLLAGPLGLHPLQAGWTILNDRNGYSSRNIPDEAFQRLGLLAKQGSELKSISFAPNGGWAILHDKNGYFTRNIPDEAFQRLGLLAKQGVELKGITFTPSGGWAILYDKNSYVTRNIPDEAFQKLGDFARQGSALQGISFTPKGGWVILLDKNGYFARNIPEEAFQRLGLLAKQGAELKSISFASDGGWAILYDQNGYFARNIPDEAFQRLGDLAKLGAARLSLSFTLDATTIRLSQDDAATRQKVLQRMANHKVPGMSVAVIQNNRIVFARGYGVLQAGGSRSVTADTQFQAASISKPVTALAALLLFLQGKLDLDGDLNKRLTTWKIPENELTRKRPVTVRQVLTHSAGFTVGGFGGYGPGQKLPSLRQVLDGVQPANSPAIRVDFAPGTKTRYSGGGFCVLQQAMMDVSGRPFAPLMKDLVLTPLGMNHSSFEQPLPENAVATAAVAHQNGTAVPGNWHTYPEQAAAGLWTTPTDLARVILAVQSARRGDKGAILPADLTAQMLTRQIDNWGLSFALAGKDNSLAFTHGGRNHGYRSLLIGYAATGQGAVIMINEDASSGLIDEMMRDIRIEYGWPN